MLDLIASCDQSFRDGLRVREKQALSPSCLDLLKQHVYYDPTSENGLRWATALRSRNGRGHELGDAIGNNFFIGKHAFQSSSIALILHDIWPEDGQNVVTRKNPNGHWGDVANLEWAVHGDSRRRSSELKRMALVRSVLGHDGPDLGDRLRLNAPCKKGHLWNGHQLGLYHKGGSSWKCDQCEKQRKASPEYKAASRERYKHDPEDQRRKARERAADMRQDPKYAEICRDRSRKGNAKRRATHGRISRTGLLVPPHLIGYGIQSADLQPFIAAGFDLSQIDPATVTESRDLHRQMRQSIQGLALSPSVAQLVMDEQKRYWRENPDAYREHGRQWGQASWWLKYQTRPDLRLYTRQKTRRRKALERGSVGVHVKGRQIKERFALFGNCCAYCGASGDMEIEHVIPISKGGTHVLGNILPACHDCNSSKRAKEVEGWYRAQPFFTEGRWRKICRTLGWHRSSVGQLALL